MYTDQNGVTHYEADEYVERAAHFIKNNLPQLVTVAVGIGVLVVAVKINKNTRHIDQSITRALRVQDDWTVGCMEDILKLKLEGRKHKFYPGLGVLVDDVVQDLKKTQEAVKNGN